MTAKDWRRVRLIAERVAELRALNPDPAEELRVDARSAKEVVDHAADVYVKYLDAIARKPHPLECSAIFMQRLLLEPFR